MKYFAHVRQSGPDSGLGFQSNVLKTFQGVPFPLRSGGCGMFLQPTTLTTQGTAIVVVDPRLLSVT